MTLTDVKDKDEPEDRPGAVYQIKCSQLPGHLSKSVWLAETRLNGHKQATKKGDLKDNIAKHHSKASHTIDWDSGKSLTYSARYCQWITLESWFTNLEPTALNCCQSLPTPYKQLLNRKQ